MGCRGWLQRGEKPSETEMIECVKQYTEKSGWLCPKINLALAADHEPSLREHSRYIRCVKYCCGKLPGWTGPLYRGVDLTDSDLDEMKELGTFYFPTFTSAWEHESTALNGKNTLFYLDCAD